MPMTYKGTIEGFAGNWMSGLGALLIHRHDGLHPVHCENAATVRALDGCFGDVIAPGHTVNNDAIRGKEIVYSVDDMGILLAFTPVDEWSGPEIPDEGLPDVEEDVA